MLGVIVKDAALAFLNWLSGGVCSLLGGWWKSRKAKQAAQTVADAPDTDREWETAAGEGEL